MEANNKDYELIVSKMDQMTPKERVNHDFKLNLLKKAEQMMMKEQKETPMQQSKENESKET
jgi:hypothetical protein